MVVQIAGPAVRKLALPIPTRRSRFILLIKLITNAKVLGSNEGSSYDVRG